MRTPALLLVAALLSAGCLSSAPKQGGAAAPAQAPAKSPGNRIVDNEDQKQQVRTVGVVRAPGREVERADKGGGANEGQAQPLAARVAAGGLLVEEEVRRAVEASFSTFDGCYAHVGGHAKGDLSVRLAIQPAGDVTESVVTKSSFRVAKFDDCVAGAAKKIQFPKAQDGSSFIVPIEFDR